MGEIINQKTNDKDNIDFAFHIMSRKIDMQNNAHNTLESKIGILLGFVGVIAGSAIALLEKRLALLGLNIFTIGLFGLYLTLIALVVASQSRVYLDPPDFPDFYSKETLAKNNLDYKNQIVSNMKSAYISNGTKQLLKSQLYNFSVYCFLLSITFMFLGIMEK